jgi:hypothetical protein
MLRAVRWWLNTSLILIVGLAVVFLLGGQPAYSAEHVHAINQPEAGDPVEVVLSYASQMRADDGLVEVRPGVWAKSSNVYGVSVGGTAFYYQIGGHASFDPVSLGRITPDQAQVVRILEQPGFTIAIYLIPGIHTGDHRL